MNVERKSAFIAVRYDGEKRTVLSGGADQLPTKAGLEEIVSSTGATVAVLTDGTDSWWYDGKEMYRAGVSGPYIRRVFANEGCAESLPAGV